MKPLDLFWFLPFGWFNDLIGFVIVASASLLIGYFAYRIGRGKDEVCYLNPHNMMGYDLQISQETARSLDCDSQHNLPAKHFLKYWGGYNIRKGKGRSIKRFLAVEANLFTTTIGNPTGQIMKVAEWVKDKLGAQYESGIKAGARKILEEEDKVGITVQIVPPDAKDSKTQKPFAPDVTEDDYLKDAEIRLPDLLSQGIEGLRSKQYLEKLAWAGTGFAIACVLFILKVLKL